MAMATAGSDGGRERTGSEDILARVRHTGGVRAFWVIAFLVLLVVVGTLLVLLPVSPERPRPRNEMKPSSLIELTDDSAPLRERVRQRLQLRPMLVGAYLGAVAVVALVLVVW